MLTDPKKLIKLIDGLVETMRSWTILYAETHAKAIKVQSVLITTKDGIDTFVRRMKTEVSEAMERSNSVQGVVENCMRDARDASKRARKTSQAATRLKALTASFLTQWQSALSQAEAELKAAGSALDLARNELALAQSTMQAAESARDAAQFALSSCVNSRPTDIRGNRVAPNCSLERARLDDANLQLANARNNVSYWMNEVGPAEHRFRISEAEVSRCAGGVNAAVQFGGRAARTSRDCTKLRQQARASEVIALEAEGLSQSARREAESAQVSAEAATNEAARMTNIGIEAESKLKLLRHAKLEQETVHTKSMVTLQAAITELIKFDQEDSIG